MIRVVESEDNIGLEPRQRTALDGKTWWVVYDTEEQKYSTLTVFGKYKTKRECQQAIEKYSNNLTKVRGM